MVKQNVSVSPDVALLLERALDCPPRFWSNLAAEYERNQSEAKERLKLPAYQTWARSFHMATLHRHGVLAPGDSGAAAVEKLLRFFQVASPDAFEQTWVKPRVSFRRSQAFTVAEHNTALWLRLVERCAEKLEVSPFRTGALRKRAALIPSMTNLDIPNGFLAAQAALAEAGVVLVFVRQVPDTRVCAATWWLSADRPVIGITERQRRPDIFWFSLLHEIGHLVLHPRRTTFLDLEQEKGAACLENDPAEQEADDFAESVLLPPGADQLIRAATTRQDLTLLAAKLGIGGPIIAGQHGHMTNNWSVGAPLRGKITDEQIDELEGFCSINS
jgi:HTH-type transcriptional regulator/antitoxin HigA